MGKVTKVSGPNNARCFLSFRVGAAFAISIRRFVSSGPHLYSRVTVENATDEVVQFTVNQNDSALSVSPY